MGHFNTRVQKSAILLLLHLLQIWMWTLWTYFSNTHVVNTACWLMLIRLTHTHTNTNWTYTCTNSHTYAKASYKNYLSRYVSRFESYLIPTLLTFITGIRFASNLLFSSLFYSSTSVIVQINQIITRDRKNNLKNDIIKMKKKVV